VTSLGDVEAVSSIMAAFPRPWFIAGGWAIDLFMGTVSRRHEDLEVGIFRRDQHILRAHLSGWNLEKVIQGPNGGMWVPWNETEWLELPIHQVKARRAGATPPEFELFLNELTGSDWWFRRKSEITHPASEIALRTAAGIPFLAPEIQLLYKARLHRLKDEHDFELARNALDAKQRSWLREALALFAPDDPWLKVLKQNH
jgi:hypothetical protein